MTSRRDFLRSTAALAGLAATSRLFADDKNDAFGGFTVGVQSYTFRNSKLEPALKRIQDLGIKYGEFYSAHLNTNSMPEQIEAFKKLAGEYGITAVAFGVQ